MQDAERDQVQEHDRGDEEDPEGDARVLAHPENVEPGDAPDDGDHHAGLGEGADRHERRPVDDGAHGRDAGGQDVVDHDRRDRHEGGHRAEHEVGERVDTAATDVVQLEDVRDLDHAAREHPHDQRRDRDEEDRLRTDEAMRLGRRVEDRGRLVHEGDDADREPAEIPLPARGVAEQGGAPEQEGEQDDEREVETSEDWQRHAERGLVRVTCERTLRSSGLYLSCEAQCPHCKLQCGDGVGRGGRRVDAGVVGWHAGCCVRLPWTCCCSRRWPSATP